MVDQGQGPGCIIFIPCNKATAYSGDDINFEVQSTGGDLDLLNLQSNTNMQAVCSTVTLSFSFVFKIHNFWCQAFSINLSFLLIRSFNYF